MEIDVGQKFVRQNNPELGVGIVTAIEGRFIDVLFPDTATRLRLTKEAPGLRLIELGVGDEVEYRQQKSTITHLVGSIATLADGSVAELEDLWPIFTPPSLIDRLVAGETDRIEHVVNRLDG